MTPQEIVEFFKRLSGRRTGIVTISIKYDPSGNPEFTLHDVAYPSIQGLFTPEEWEELKRLALEVEKERTTT